MVFIAITTALGTNITNGTTTLGTLTAKQLPKFLSSDPANTEPPWGSNYSAQNSDGYLNAPDTGVVRRYDLTITRGTIAPDGFERQSLLINNAFPGPLIEANWGDTIQVTVNNKITGPEEGTTMHWHGFLHPDSEWEDGVPGISQCPIPPGDSFTYSFKATPHGTTWYHSHFSAQYLEGLWGPLVIYGPETASYDIDLGPVAISDYFHRGYFDILTDVMGTDLLKVRPASDNNLINGKMNYDCSKSTLPGSCTDNAGISKFAFASGKQHRLRLINTGIQAMQKFSIDHHNMTVIANDFVQVEPYVTNIVTLAVGQRTDVIVSANGNPNGTYFMRANITSGQCTEPTDQSLALAAIYYEHADTSLTPTASDSDTQLDTTDPCTNSDLSIAVPAYRIPALEPSTTLHMEVNVTVNSTGHLIWTVNDSAFRTSYNDPLLLLANQGNTSYPYDPQWNVYDVGTNETIRAIIRNLSPTSHPWHLHGHEMQVLSSGDGDWDGSIVNEANPQRRDTQVLPANGHIVVQWNSDNPGVWPFHCHIGWHLSGGLYTNILEQEKKIRAQKIPQASFDNCKTWDAYTVRAVIDQIDAGL
ncbi:uncharacterized protein KY384_006264 [Bacidia gigantensis]|uniref:uncharacterized protein n=1 Tax=Bacidia gigantensis TaxID=2732470 RepID=UPI001D05A30E|nr:uncharacterized protein KY384_006264 [Bacidia gigantensis]KAG8528577.1 hypothetical protein KY384_006264 [Bacidia gigantensis]